MLLNRCTCYGTRGSTFCQTDASHEIEDGVGVSERFSKAPPPSEMSSVCRGRRGLALALALTLATARAAGAGAAGAVVLARLTGRSATVPPGRSRVAHQRLVVWVV